MDEARRSQRALAGLVALLALLTAVGVFLPQGGPGGVPAPTSLPAPRPVVALVAAGAVLLIYGGLGWLGLRLGRRVGFPELLDPSVPARARWGLPVATGVAVGLAFVAVDRGFVVLFGLTPLPHPPFPTSVVASLAAGIGEEIVFRLFFMALWLRILERVRPGWGRSSAAFWLVAALSGVAFVAAHLPSILFAYGVEGPAALPGALLGELLVLNGSLSLVAAWHLRHQGLVAAVGVHLWADVVWHVLYGAL